MPRTSRRLVLVLLPMVLAALALVATPASAAGGTSDSQVAKAGTIQQQDIGRSWKGTKQSEAGNKLALEAAKGYPDCTDYVAFTTANNKQPTASSKDWELTGQTLSNKSFVYKNAATAATSMEAVGSADMAGCLTKVFESVLVDQLSANAQASANVASWNVKIDPVTGLPPVGDQAVGYSGGVQINYKDGTSEQLITGVLVVQVDNVLLSYSFSAPPATSDDVTTALDQAIDATISRTQKALKK